MRMSSYFIVYRLFVRDLTVCEKISHHIGSSQKDSNLVLSEGPMGERGEVYSTKLVKNDRTYFFNVKENVYGDLYLNIVESRPTDIEGRFLRQSVIVYQEDLGEFVKEFQKTLDFVKQNGTKKKSRFISNKE